MGNEEMYLKKSLNQSSYKCLQKIGKLMGIPCNIKKEYLIELIRAKKFSSQSEVISIIKRIQKERRLLVEVKRNLKRNEMHNKKPQLPPIATTSKCKGATIPCSVNLYHVVIRNEQSQDLAHVAQKTLPPTPKMQNGSDRVLRSFSLKKTNENMGVFKANNTVVDLIKTHNSSSLRETKIEIASHKSNMPKFNVMAKCLEEKHKLGLDSTAYRCNRTYENMQVQASNQVSSPPPKEMITKYGLVQSVGLRDEDGKIAQIQALVQKRSTCTENYEILNFPKPEINLQNIMSCKIDTQTANSSLMEFVMEDSDKNNNYQQFQDPMPSLENEIQSNLQATDQVNIRLPQINAAFAQFEDLTQPLYAQVSDVLETIDMHQVSAPRNNTNCGMLESICNFRSQYLTNQSFLPIATTSNTNCVFSTSIISTPKELPSTTTTFIHDDPCMTPNEANGENVDGVTSSLTLDLFNEESECTSIPEMLEDAYEVISQDNYREQLGMDLRMQCMLCSWAGPMVMLQYHLYKDHTEQISKQSGSEWNITYTLGDLVRQVGLSQIVEYEAMLYILSAQYEDPDYFWASIRTLSFEPGAQRKVSITTYNKVTGEPHSWQGRIPLFHTSASQQFEPNDHCFKVELSKLNLLPNSANLKLLNRALVNDSPHRVVVGQPELNDIDIMLFVKIFD